MTEPLETAAQPAGGAEVMGTRGGEMVPLKPHEQAIVNAAEAALTQQDIPGRDEFLALAMMARVLSLSSIVPRDLRGKPADVFVVLLTARDLGVNLTAGLRKIYVIDGQPSIAPQLLNARIRQLGLGQILPGPRSSTGAVAIAVGPGGRVDARCRATWPEHIPDCGCLAILGDTSFSAAEAATAGLANKDNWKHYPARMLWWRAAGYAADDFFPEASLGLYSPDELGAITDADGNPIDPKTVEIPEGYQKAGAALKQEEPADAVILLELGLRASALPAALREELRLAIKERELPKLREMTPTKLKVFRPLLDSFERKAAGEPDWDAEAAYVRVLEDFQREHCGDQPPTDSAAPPEAPQAPARPPATDTTVPPPSGPQGHREAPQQPARALVETTEDHPCPFCSSHPCECLVDVDDAPRPTVDVEVANYAPGEEPF